MQKRQNYRKSSTSTSSILLFLPALFLSLASGIHPSLRKRTPSPQFRSTRSSVDVENYETASLLPTPRERAQEREETRITRDQTVAMQEAVLEDKAREDDWNSKQRQWLAKAEMMESKDRIGAELELDLATSNRDSLQSMIATLQG